MPARTPLAALVAVAALLVLAPAAGAATIVVDDDGVECPNAAVDTIQEAVDADAFDTIAVCAGTYREAVGLDRNGVLIDRPVTIKGAGADRVRIEPDGDLRDPLPDGGIFNPRDDQGNVISVDNTGPVHISGVTVAGGSAGEPRGAEAGIVFLNSPGSVRQARVTDVVPADIEDFSNNVGYGVVAVAEDGAERTFTLANTAIDRHAKGGVLIRGAGLTGTVADSVIRGRGPLDEAGKGQNGIQVSFGAKAAITGNEVTDHRHLPDESASVGVLLYDADAANTTITGNDFRGNGYGVFNADIDGCDSATPVTATDNYWGHPAGPTPDETSGPTCPETPYGPTGTAPSDRVNGLNGFAVTYEPHALLPHGTPLAPGAAEDTAPVFTSTTPANGAVVSPKSDVTVTATAEDDFDVKRVEVRRNGVTVPVTKSSTMYSAKVAPPPAGGTIAVTVVAYDSAGQSTARSISLRGQAPTTPREPAAPEDRPPSVSFTSPGSGAALDPRAAPRLTADASDDKGVARVAFLDDGKPVCVDDAAPFDCAYAPTGDDVGRNTLIAVAYDGAGQTAADFRAVSVGRFNPVLTARTTPKRDRRRPYRYRTTGKLTLPAGVSAAQACGQGGGVQVQFAAGRLKLPMIAALKPDCSFRTAIAFPTRRPLGRRGRLTVTYSFAGNEVLGPALGKKLRIRAG